MKKKMLVTLVIFVVLAAICNINEVLPKMTFTKLFLGDIEAMAKPECSVYDREDQILDEVSYYCNVHKGWCTRIGCVNEYDKCCDTRCITSPH